MEYLMIYYSLHGTIHQHRTRRNASCEDVDSMSRSAYIMANATVGALKGSLLCV